MTLTATHPTASQREIDTVIYGATARPSLNLEGRANAELGVSYLLGAPAVVPVKKLVRASDKPGRSGGER